MPLLQFGQTLKGGLGRYVIKKRIQDTVWFTENQCKETVVIKGHLTPHIRPLLDEVQDPAEPPIIMLKHLDDYLLNSSIKKRLHQKELKYVARIGHNRFSEVQLGDLGGCYSVDSGIARGGTPVGAAVWSRPEVIMETPWNPATDIRSFGAVLRSLIYGGNFSLFRPLAVPYGHEEYNLEVLKQQSTYRYFGPFPAKYEEIASPKTITAILYLMHKIPQSETTPFSRTTKRELDWRDRPTAQGPLKDGWFQDR
ncbi:putative serine/threonine protein kinase [Aspergillus lucknowensis]|uniref:Protein kinase domain-containing protein n=1 Tax=Aspergillus lucknowensis TaxID=176173 RepID=A0ABR4LNB1_9EURO